MPSVPAAGTHLHYPALYHAARRAAQALTPSLPYRTLRRGTVLYRYVPAGLDAVQARTIHGSQARDDNRWSGRTAPGPDGPAAKGVGGLYLARDLDAFGGEFFEHVLGMTLDEDLRRGNARPGAGPPPARLTAAQVRREVPSKCLYVYRVTVDVLVGDLRPTRAAGAHFVGAVWGAPAVQRAAADTPYRHLLDACGAPADHSFPRGVCQGLYDAGRHVPGVLVRSVRVDAEMTGAATGQNVVFLGVDGQEVAALGAPVRHDWTVNEKTGLMGERVRRA